MPAFDYRCLNCKRTTEITAPIRPKHQKCSYCGTEMVPVYQVNVHYHPTKSS